MTKAKRIEKKANKVAKEVEAPVTAKQAPEEIRRVLLAKALGKNPKDVTVSSGEGLSKESSELYEKALKGMRDKPAPEYKPINEPEEVVEEIIDDLERGEEDEIEIIEVAPVKGKKVISQNSAQAQKLIAKKVFVSTAKDKLVSLVEKEIDVIAPAKKKLGDMNEKERKEYYTNLCAKASAAKRAKAEAKLVAGGNTDLLEKVPETTLKVVKKATRTTQPEAQANPLGGRVIPEDMTGRNLKTILKAENKAENKAKKNSKPTTGATSKRTTTPLSKMTIEELEAIKGTIADVQWNKYFKMAGGVSGDAVKKVAKPVVEKVAEVEPVIVKKVVRTAAPAKPEVKVKVLTLSDFSLDELIEELKARGCKGTIKICAEVEL